MPGAAVTTTALALFLIFFAVGIVEELNALGGGVD
jgi:hypothetical protein